jgi:hypothetical protein
MKIVAVGAGMAPIALGADADSRVPMGVTVIGA